MPSDSLQLRVGLFPIFAPLHPLKEKLPPKTTKQVKKTARTPLKVPLLIRCTHTHTSRQLTKATFPETLISAFLPLCARAWERKAGARRRKPAPANNRRKPVIRVEALRKIPGSGGRRSLRNPDRKGLHGTEMSQNLTKLGGKSSRDLRRALDEASCQMKR